MKTLKITLLTAAASALLITAASAAPLAAGSSGLAASAALDSNIQQVRMVCNDRGRCWREHSERRVIREERDYGPRERMGRGYDDRGGGVGIRAPGVSVGIGGGDRY
ncbi:MAG: hypothetical protein ABW213_11740 [Tardiphaga sp.]